ncbi:MAG: restriction endonuclease subunit S [Methylomonas sp.]|nr:MAG: restriction endonuclease subunit S [Methylomonas sp.]
MKTWREYKLGSISKMMYGKMPPQSIMADSGYPIYTGYRIAGFAKKYLFEEPKLIIVARGVGGTGDVKISPAKAWITNLAIVIDLDDCIADKKFLCELLGLSSLKDKLDSGSAQSQITISSLESFKVKLPCLAVQQKIAAILSAYDDLIENNLKRIKLLEEMAQITYEEWFVRLKFPGHETTQLDSATGLPLGWRRITLDDACDVSGGGTPSTEVDEYWNGGDIAWFSPTDLSKNNSLVLLDSAQKITQKGLQKSSAKLMQPTGFMMTSRATIGLFGLFDKPFCTNQGFINVMPKHESHKYFLLFNFKLRVPEFLNYASGATFPELSKSKFKRLKIDWPTETLLEKWHEVSNPMIQEITNLSKQNQLLKEARDILLPRLMTGMIDVDTVGADLSARMNMVAPCEYPLGHK